MYRDKGNRPRQIQELDKNKRYGQKQEKKKQNRDRNSDTYLSEVRKVKKEAQKGKRCNRQKVIETKKEREMQSENEICTKREMNLYNQVCRRKGEIRKIYASKDKLS